MLPNLKVYYTKEEREEERKETTRARKTHAGNDLRKTSGKQWPEQFVNCISTADRRPQKTEDPRHRESEEGGEQGESLYKLTSLCLPWSTLRRICRGLRQFTTYEAAVAAGKLTPKHLKMPKDL